MIVSRDMSSAIQYLRNAVRHNRLANVLLFVGEDSAAKETAVVDLASGLLCESKRPFTIPGCGACPCCVRIQHFTHPNIVWLMSDAERRRRASTDAQDKTSASDEIRIDQIRELKRDQRLQAFEPGPSFYAVVDADRLTTQASNALLKTLEEPGLNQFLVLLAKTTSAVLPTILSRCQRLLFPSEAHLAQHDDDIIVRLLEKIEQSSVAQRVNLIEDFAANREDLKQALQALQNILLHSARTNSVLAKRKHITQILLGIETALFELNSHVHPQLVTEKLLLSSWPVVTPRDQKKPG